MKLILVSGARPNFMKIAPLIRAIKKHNETDNKKIEYILVHTGQHYDYKLSEIFFKELEIPPPDIYLGIGSGTHAEQTGKVMIEFEKILLNEKPDIVVVVGDVNSTLAASLATVKLHIKVAHIEAGLRSFDKKMPEEINRLLTDAISDYLFTPSLDANENLSREGIPQEKIFYVGDIMIDNLFFNLPKAKNSKILEKLNLIKQNYALLTLHRPSNVDDKDKLESIIEVLVRVSNKIKIVFPIHPRTHKNIINFGLNHILTSDNIILIEPLGYIDFLNLIINSKLVITDSGGIQEETTVLGIPCLTLRDTTERPITIETGTNTLIGNNPKKLIEEIEKIMKGKARKANYPELWDGKTAERIIQILISRN